MRILMLNNEFPPLGGGTGVVNYHLLKEMAAFSNIWIDLVTSSRTKHTCEIEQFSERINLYKVPVDNQNIHHSSNRELLTYSHKSLLLCYKLLRQHHYDVSFAFAGVPAGVLSYILKITKRLPYLVSLQGPDVPGFEARYDYLYPFLKPILRSVWRNATVVTAISQQHQKLAFNTLRNIDIPIVYNGVDTNAFYPLHIPRDCIRLLCVGRLIERKGQHYLIQAFANLCQQIPHKKLQLTLVGTGDSEHKLKSLVQQLGIAHQVHFSGFVPRESMPEIYRQADVFVLPSQNEGMSIALLEAFASGLPVIVTNTGGTDELVSHRQNGIVVNWSDINSLTAALRNLIEDDIARQSMGATNRQIAETLSWDTITKQYIALIDTIVSRASSRNAFPA